MVDIVQQVSTDIVLSDKSEAEAGTNNTKFMTPLRTKEAIDKNLVPFNAMSQSQFEAIRAANNEEFAASGFVHFGKHWGVSPNINQGLISYTGSGATPNSLIMGRRGDNQAGDSKTSNAYVNIAGIVFDTDYLHINSASSHSLIKFPSAPDGKTTYNKATGAIVTHVDSTTAFAAQAADSTNVEVVVDRVDMWGFEAWLEEVNTTNPYIYPNGLIQSQATAMDGITTSASARPVTYYAVFDGDTGSKGKGVNFFTLTDAQKKKVLGNHKNNLYYLDDGRLVQWRLRQRTIAGAGNGDWFNITSHAPFPLKFSAIVDVAPQGASNSVSDSGVFWYAQQMSEYNSTKQIGVFASPPPTTLVSASGECYFLVCGTVNRLNQGAYHPSFNPSGTQPWNKSDGWGEVWSHISVVGPLSITAAFIKAATIGGIGTPYNTNKGGSINSDTVKGRPDGRSYDAIYADGFGGVCRDMRYSANGLTPTDFAEADQRVKNGTYRGFEKAVFTKIVQESYPLDTVNTAHFIRDPDVFKGNALSKTALKVGGYFYKYFNGVLYSSKITNLVQEAGGDQLAIYTVDSLPRNAGTLTVLPVFMESQVGGSFLQTTQYGNPSALLQAFPNGWQGDWGGLL